MANIVKIDVIIQKLRIRFRENLVVKTNWGRDQVMEQLNLALIDVLSEYVGKDILIGNQSVFADRPEEEYDYFISYRTDTGRVNFTIEKLPRILTRTDLYNLARQLGHVEILSVGLLARP